MRPQVMDLDEQECLHGDVKEAEMGIDEWRAARDRDRAQREAKWAQQKESAGLSVDPLERIARDINTIKNILIILVVLTAISVISVATLR